MKPLDLSTHAPRGPRAQLGGIIFLPRTIDKARASLPGGKLGLYTMQGFSAMMLETLGVAAEDFIIRVGAAASDDEIAAFIQPIADPERVAAWNRLVLERLPRNGDRASAIVHYPWLANRPDLILAVDVLEEDDRQIFRPAP